MSALFTGEAYFCPKCGTILPLPEVCDIVKCRTCSYQQKASRRLDLASWLRDYFLLHAVSEQAEYSSVVICVPSKGDEQSRELQSEGGPFVSTTSSAVPTLCW